MRRVVLFALILMIAACASAPTTSVRSVALDLVDPPTLSGTPITLTHLLNGGVQASGGVGTGFKDDRITLGLGLTVITGGGLALQFHLQNFSSAPLSVLWDQTSLVGPDGIARRVLHKGVRLADRGATMPPTTVPPGAALQDFVFPAELLGYQGGVSMSRYDIAGSWVADQFFETLQPGQTVTLYMPVQIGGMSRGYSFKFVAR